MGPVDAEGAAVLGFGEHRALSYNAVYTQHPEYCKGILKVHPAGGPLLQFQNWVRAKKFGTEVVPPPSPVPQGVQLLPPDPLRVVLGYMTEGHLMLLRAVCSHFKDVIDGMLRAQVMRCVPIEGTTPKPLASAAMCCSAESNRTNQGGGF